MIHNSKSHNIEYDDSNLNTNENDYKILIARLKEIQTIIKSLEKTIFK